jgi:hypothetical protein
LPYHPPPADAPLPTVRSALAAGCQVHAVCRTCDRIVRLDIGRLAGQDYAETPLIQLPRRCQCGSSNCGVAVSGRLVRDD